MIAVSIRGTPIRRPANPHRKPPMASRPALYAHPFSSYSQKVLIALYENDIPFEYRNLESEEHRDALARLWPLRRFPVLVDDGRTIVEATTIIEHLALRHPGPVALLPHDAIGEQPAQRRPARCDARRGQCGTARLVDAGLARHGAVP